MLKKLALGCLLVVAGIAVGAYFAWRQFTRLPAWYVEPAAAELTAERPASDEAGSYDADAYAGDTSRGDIGGADRPVPGRGAPQTVDELRRSSGRVELDERQLSEILVHSLDEHRNGRRVRRAAKAVRASFHGDRLEVGVVTSLSDLAAVAESGNESEVVRRLGRLAPWLKDRDFYLAARGKPGVRNGNLYFDRDVELVVGGIGLNAADTAARLGVELEELQDGAELPISGLRLEDVEVDGDRMVLLLAGS